MKKLIISICALIAAASISFAQDINEATDLYNAAAEYLDLGDKVSALDNFKKAYDIAKECGEVGEDLISKCESLIPRLSLMVAKDFVKAGNYEGAVAQALEAVETAKAMNDEDVALEAEALVPQIWMQKGNTCIKAKDWEGAVAAYKNNLAINPTNGKAMVNMAAAYEKLGMEAEAEAAYVEAAANGQEKAANKALGNIYLKKANAANKAKKYDEVVKLAQKSISYNESDKAYYLAGLASQASNKIDDAITYFEKYLELAPSAANSQDVRAVVEGLKKAQNK